MKLSEGLKELKWRFIPYKPLDSDEAKRIHDALDKEAIEFCLSFPIARRRQPLKIDLLVVKNLNIVLWKPPILNLNLKVPALLFPEYDEFLTFAERLLRRPSLRLSMGEDNEILGRLSVKRDEIFQKPAEPMVLDPLTSDVELA
jgi:hypothetical protein